jgi:hypothetical protein
LAGEKSKRRSAFRVSAIVRRLAADLITGGIAVKSSTLQLYRTTIYIMDFYPENKTRDQLIMLKALHRLFQCRFDRFLERRLDGLNPVLSPSKCAFSSPG